MDEAQLKQVWQNRQRRDRTSTLSEPLGRLMTGRIGRRVRQVGQIVAAWDECIPQYIRDHAGVVGYARGTLTVAVDSAPHRYQLRMLLDGGLLAILRERFTAGPINRVRITPGSPDLLPAANRPEA